MLWYKANNFVSPKQMLARYRALIFVGGALYPAYYYNYISAVPGAHESLLERSIVGLFGLGIVAASFRLERVRKHIGFWFVAFTTIMYLHGFYSTMMNHMDLNYVWGGFVVVVGIGAAVMTMEALLFFFAVAIACSGWAYYSAPAPDRWLYFNGIVTVLIVNFLSLRAILKVMAQLKAKTEEHLQLSAAVQSMFLPNHNHFENNRVRLHGFYRAMEKCGGDWWWYNVSEQGAQIIVGDITGHGPGPAMMTASIASYMRALQSALGTHNMPELIHALNRQVLQIGDASTSRFNHCMCLSTIDIDFKTMTLRAWFAASPMIMVISADGQTNILSGSGSLLGSEDFKLGYDEYKLKYGDRIALFTDGLFEARNNLNSQYGERKLMKNLALTMDMKPQEAAANMISKIDAFCATTSQEDDYTLVILDILDPAGAKSVNEPKHELAKAS